LQDIFAVSLKVAELEVGKKLISF